MKKAVSTILVFCVFISVAGYTIPCTLHCLYMDMDMELDGNMEMCHHAADSEMDCNGSCMVNNVSDSNTETANTNAARSEALLLTQYRVNLLSADTGLHNITFDPLRLETYFDVISEAMHKTWIPDPPIPPPQFAPYC